MFPWVSKITHVGILITKVTFFTDPSALVLDTSPTATDTTITITGTIPTGSVVTGIVVQLQRYLSVGCSNTNNRSLTMYQGFSGSFRITELEPGNRYTINTTVFNAAGSGPVSNSVTATTMQTSKRLSQYCMTCPCYSLLLIHSSYTRSQLSQKWYSHCQ